MNKKQKPLVLFDIDGTLLKDKYSPPPATDRFALAIREVFGVHTAFKKSLYNGTIQRYILWDMARRKGVTRDVFEKHYKRLQEAEHAFFLEAVKKIPKPYVIIESAVQFLKFLHNRNVAHTGVITGNSEIVSWWKVEYAGIKPDIEFGLFGNEADSREELAQHVFTKAQTRFKRDFQPTDIVLIGDTIHDIRAGHAIGARTIAVTYGGHGRLRLTKEKPDLIVDSLLESSVRDFF